MKEKEISVLTKRNVSKQGYVLEKHSPSFYCAL